MKIAFVSFEYPPFVQGGAGVYAKNITRELAKLGNDVHVITPQISGCKRESVEEGCFIHRIGFINKPFLAAASFWFSLVKNFSSLEKQAGGFDIVYSNGLSDFSLGRKIVSSPRISTIHHLTITGLNTLRGGFISRVRNPRGDTGISPLIEPLCIKRADRIIAVSQFTKQDIMNVFNIPESKIEVIYHGVNPDNYVFSEEDKVKVRNALGINAQPLVLFVGGLSTRKGVDVLLRALPHVIKEVDMKLVLIGSGYKNDYQRLAESLGISDKLSFLGHVADDTLRLLYSSCDLFVLPSRLEGLGIVILEAMAAGKPVVATNVGGIPELIESGQNGILVEVNKEGKLANAIVKMLSDKSFARAIGDNNMKKTRERYSWEIAAQRTERLYHNLIKK